MISQGFLTTCKQPLRTPMKSQSKSQMPTPRYCRGLSAVQKRHDQNPLQGKSANHQYVQKKFKFGKSINTICYSFYFLDLIYGEKDTNRDVYEQTVRRVVLSSLEGINGTVFVYGQTGTGKTYTMMGHQRSNPKQNKSSASNFNSSMRFQEE